MVRPLFTLMAYVIMMMTLGMKKCCWQPLSRPMPIRSAVSQKKKEEEEGVAFIDLFEIIYHISQTNMVDKQMWRNPRRQTGGLESKLKLVADTVADDGSSMSGTLFRIYY